MTDFAEILFRPFVDFKKVLSDFPVTLAFFIGFIGMLVSQDIVIGFKVFGLALALEAVIYVLTFGSFYGKGGQKKKLNIRS